MFSLNIHMENTLKSQSEILDFIDGVLGVVNNDVAGVGK